MSLDYLHFCKTVDSRYRILGKLGEGRYGKVYLAYDDFNYDLVALKLLRLNSLRYKIHGFLKEIRTLIYLS